MDRPQELRDLSSWHLAIWSLRVGYLDLLLVLSALLITFSSHTPWLLAVGVVIWLVVSAVTSTGFFVTWARLPLPRPGYWALRYMLIYDSVHLSSTSRP